LQIGYTGTTNSLLASGIYGIIKVIATSIFVLLLVDTLGRKPSLFISAMGMGILFFIVGALLKEFPPPSVAPPSPPHASKAMAAMIYIFVCFYSVGSISSSSIFRRDNNMPSRSPDGMGSAALGLCFGHLPDAHAPLRSRSSIRVAVALECVFPPHSPSRDVACVLTRGTDFVVSRITLTIETNLGYKMYFMFATINIGALAVFALLIPETKGRSLEEMDIIFGSVDAGKRRADIAEQERGASFLYIVLSLVGSRMRPAVLEHHHNDVTSDRSVDGGHGKDVKESV
jgi:hypothetical protein